MRLLPILLLLPVFAFNQTRYQKDFQQFWNDFNNNYAYFDRQQIDWAKVKAIYQPLADTIKNTPDFVRLLEQVVNELHNGHVSLNANLPSSNRIIPSGSDLFIEKKKNAYFIADIRENSAASLSGLRAGMQVTKFGGKPIGEQLHFFLPRYPGKHTNEMNSYAINMLFAGTHNKPREISVIHNGKEKIFYPDSFKPSTTDGLVHFKIVENNTGYIKINNSLGNFDLIKKFDAALDSLLTTRALILDLTETPAGGNTTVARAIMGRFIIKEMPYQKHVIQEKPYGIIRSWVEYVLPRGKQYKNKLVLMVGHWTGSMGEGMAIGFDAMKRATITGTKMAGLLGAINGFRVSETGIGYQIPTERLYHINGSGREDFIPGFLISNSKETWEKAKQLAGIQ